MSERFLRVGVIGLGIGRGHVKGFQSHPRAEVVAVADPDEERCRRIKEEQRVPSTYRDAREMLERERLDVVSIATPNHLHRELAVAALESGAHVLCEKPMAMSAAEGREMIAAAERAGRRLMINFSYRFSSQSQALRRLVDTGVLGHVYNARTVWLRRHGFPKFGGWFSDRALSGGGPLIDLGVHRIDLALWLMGYPQPVWAMASVHRELTEAENVRQGTAATVENHAAGMVRFDDGASLLIEASWASHRSEPEYMETHLYGVQAGLVQRNRGGGYDFVAELYETRPGGFYDVALVRSDAPARSSMEHFVDAIVDGTETPAPAAHGLIVQEILDALYLSAERGEPVRIDPSGAVAAVSG